MNSTTLSLYVHQLQDAHSGAVQSLAITKDLLKLATYPDLKAHLTKSVEGLTGGIEGYEQILDNHDVAIGGVHCYTGEGLVKEALKDAIERKFTSDTDRDLMLCAEYYRTATYGTTVYDLLLSFAAKDTRLQEDVVILRRGNDKAEKAGERTLAIMAELLKN